MASSQPEFTDRGRRASPYGRSGLSQSGQGMVEYALIIVLVAVGVVVALTAFGGQLQTAFNTISNTLSTAA